MRLFSMPELAEQKKFFQKGHRKRMQAKILSEGSEFMQDYEVVEMLLFLIFKRKDTRTLSKVLLEKFGSIGGLINANKSEILSIHGMGEKSYEALQIVKAVINETLQEKIISKAAIECFEDVISYCCTNMKYLTHEELRIIFLNGAGKVIKDQIVQRGTVDAVEAYSREIIKRCLEFGAKGIILVHNHPSGDPTPSGNDLVCTAKLKEACDVFSIVLLDHVIVGGDKYISFKNLLIL